ncbi:MAG: hypothetical protein K9N01_13380 [Cephaloticoccus sp.]|nr:hypothetical protein [Cephaloticoccus sp.]
MTLFLAHVGLLLWASHLPARKVWRAETQRWIATLLLAWGNLVITSLLLAALRHLGDPGWFFRLSLILALVTWFALRRVAPEPPTATETGTDQLSPRLLLLFCASLLPLVYMGIRIAATYEPNNYDSLTYHLPRAMYYLGQDNLAHFDTGNPRQTFFPFNYNLLQLFGLIYSPPLQVVNFINLVAWAVGGTAIYRLCRLAAASSAAALGATWLALTATQVLAQATATTNDLPTGVALLGALVFVIRWIKTQRTRDALGAGWPWDWPSVRSSR